jgi:hypothetical protein
MKLLTGNRLTTGDVVWWAGDRWVERVDAAVGLEAEAGERLLAEWAAGETINDLALVDAEPVHGGGWRPAHIRERIRAYGPTVRADLAIEGRDWR